MMFKYILTKTISWPLSCLVLFIFLNNTSFKNTYPITNLSQDYKISLKTKEEEGTISPLLMGFNIIYNNGQDFLWQNGSGKVPNFLQGLDTRILRYPGGTVATFYHWNNPTGQGHKDNWNSSFDPSKNKQKSSFMDLDEYLNLCRKLGTEPLIGINMGSGIKYDRVQEGIEEAKELVNHCIKRGIKTKYFYLDNEPYQSDANYTYTAEEYAKQVNLYTTAMKKIDPNIKIIVNTNLGNDKYTKSIVKQAGKNIDYVDVHNYWSWHNASFEKWKSQPKMKTWRGFTYSNERSYYRKMFQKLSYPNIDVVSLEWNIGPNIKRGSEYPTEAEVALMVSEQFTQLIQSGMKMTCFWPISWPKKSVWSNRGLLNSQDGYSPNKIYNMFGLYSDILGQQKIKSSASANRLINLAIKSQDGKKVWIYLINKNLDKPAVNVKLYLNDFEANRYKAVGFKSTDDAQGPLGIYEVKIDKKDVTHFTLRLPQFSFAKITLEK